MGSSESHEENTTVNNTNITYNNILMMPNLGGASMGYLEHQGYVYALSAVTACRNHLTQMQGSDEVSQNKLKQHYVRAFLRRGIMAGLSTEKLAAHYDTKVKEKLQNAATLQQQQCTVPQIQ